MKTDIHHSDACWEGRYEKVSIEKGGQGGREGGRKGGRA